VGNPYLKFYVLNHPLYRALRRCLPGTPESLNCFDEKNTRTAVQPLAVLYIFLFGNFIAAFVSESQKGVRPWYVAAYSLVAFVTLAAMGVIVACRKPSDKKGKDSDMYFHDRGTVAVGKWLVPASFLLFTGFVWAGAHDKWPNQEKVQPPTIVSADNIDDRDLPELRLGLLLTPQNFTGRVPPEFTLRLHINDPKIIDHWVIGAATGNKVKADRRLEPFTEQVVVVADDETGDFDVSVKAAKDRTGEYWIDLFLQPAGKDVEAYKRLNPDIPSQKEEKARLRKDLTDKFKGLRDSARVAIVSQRSIELVVLP
jgi:hypothetical protein